MSKNENERNAQKRTIMNEAWAMVKRTGKTFAEALKLAWRNFKLMVKMAAGKAYFSYLTKDGGIRVAKGTVRASDITYTPKGTGRPTPSHLCLYWDLDKGEYRSFIKSNLVTVA